MKLFNFKFHNCLLLIFTLFLLVAFQSCSPESTNPIAKNYHNTTARYNAYFIAKEKMKEVEGIIWKNNVDDFNKILNIFPVLELKDTAQIKAQSEDAFKKASLAIQRHKNSRWTDKCFNLIAKSRFYLKDYKNAVETYKYVNTKGKDKNAKHTALIGLMRLFIETKEYDNAVAVASYLRKEHLNKINTKDLNLVKADYFAKHNDYRKAESYIGFAIPNEDGLNERSRLFFIIGQIRQMNGDNEGAFSSFNAALKNNPTYAIAFYSRLNMAQVSDISDKGDAKKIKKNFTKLLKDIRNEDFKDKIYYEMAKFELKQDNINGGMSYLEKSIRASTINPKQKALSYLKTGEIYYEKLKKYELSKAYYDSTVNLLPKNEPDYDKIVRRQKSLANFVTQINTITTEDSLQRLGKMDTTALNNYLTKIENDQKEIARKKAEVEANTPFFSTAFDNESAGSKNENTEGANWYFYNTTALARGKSDFVKVWGNRQLEDNWRISSKEAVIAQTNNTEDSTGNTIAGNNGKTGPGGTKPGGFDRKKFLSKIPKTEEDYKKSNQKIEDAYFSLGKIYDQDLEEPKNSIEAFEKLIARFPQSEYKPETYYYLYLLNDRTKGSKTEEYKSKLASEFPNSIYSKLLNNPNYLTDSKKEEKALSIFYDKVYNLYETDRIELASAKIDSIMKAYPDNSLSDKFQIIKVLISGKTQSLAEYKQNLTRFIEKYPESNLMPYARNLLRTSDSIDKLQKETKELGGVYKPNLDNKPHYFLIAYSGGDATDTLLVNDIKKFNQDNHPEKRLAVELIKTDPKNKIILVKRFLGKYDALEYYARFKSESSPINKYKILNSSVFVISDENYQTFYQSKDLKGYLAFFEKTY